MTHPALIERITRSLAYMLRHQPEQFDLELDEFGYAPIDDVVQALNERLGEPVEVEDVRTAVESGDRVRYELKDDAIRALYGHSIDVKAGEPSKPPELLFVGVSRADAERALRHGLRAGRRRYLHLALSAEDALETARRTADDFAILTVHALDAWEEGINFFDRVALFLSDPIPTQYLELADARGGGSSTPRAARSSRPARVEAEHDTFGGDEPQERFEENEGELEHAHEAEGTGLEGASEPSSDEPAGGEGEFRPADAVRGDDREGRGGARRGRRRRRGGRRDAPGGGGGFAREGGEPDFRRPPSERPVHAEPAERAPSFERLQPAEDGARGFGSRGVRDGGERRFERPPGERRPEGPRGPRPGEPRHEHPRHAPTQRDAGDTRREHGGGRERHPGERFQGDRPAREPHASERFGRERDEGPRAPREFGSGSREAAPPQERHGFERRDERRGPPPIRPERPERGPAREERFARGDRPQRDDRPMRDDRPARDDRPRHEDRPVREERAPRDDRGPRGGGRDRGGRDGGGEGGFGVGVNEAPPVREPRRESAPPPPPPPPRQERPVREAVRERRDDDGGGFGAGL